MASLVGHVLSPGLGGLYPGCIILVPNGTNTANAGEIVKTAQLGDAAAYGLLEGPNVTAAGQERPLIIGGKIWAKKKAGTAWTKGAKLTLEAIASPANDYEFDVALATEIVHGHAAEAAASADTYGAVFGPMLPPEWFAE